MYKIAVIGDGESVLGFKAIGFDVFTETSSISGSKLIHSLAKQGYAIIFVMEDIYKKMATAISQYTNSDIPAIIPLPGKSGSDGSGMKAISHAVERAVGADIVK